MLFIAVEVANEHIADLRRAADRGRRHSAPIAGHRGAAPAPRRRRRRRSLRELAGLPPVQPAR
jgi:hypothetical protein